MTCRELVDFLMDYCNGKLPAEIHAAFEEHLAECPNCVAYMNTYRSSSEVAKRALVDDCGEVPEELMKIIVETRFATNK